MRVFVVIPVHNHVEHTTRCLDCLGRQTWSEWTAVVVDGGSTDGSANILAERYPQTVILRGDDRLWWTGATARGVDYARPNAQPTDFVLFLNNDTEFDEGYLATLVDVSLKHDRALTGSLGVAGSDPSHILHSGVCWDWRHVQSRKIPIESGADSTTRINTLPGRGTLVPIEVFKRVGNLRHRWLPHYQADYEFACRAARAGFGLVVSYNAVVRVDTDTTGSEGDLATPLSPARLCHLLFSRRSIRNVRYRTTYIALACPWRYKLRNFLALMLATVLLISNVPPLYQIKSALLRLLPTHTQQWLIQRRMLAPPRAVEST